MDGKPAGGSVESETPGLSDSRPDGDAAASEGRTSARRRSRPSAGIVRAIEACDELVSIAIRPSSRAPAPLAAQSSESDVGANALLTHSTGDGGAPEGGQLVSPFQDRESSRSATTSLPQSVSPSTEHNAWPQWLLAVSLFGGFIWYLLSSELSAQQTTRGELGSDSTWQE